MDAPRLAVDYLAAWNEDDPERRWELVTRSLAEGVEITAPGLELRGHAEVLAAIAAFRGEVPARRAQLAAPVDAHHRFARFTFRIEAEDAPLLRAGTGVLEIGADGRLSRVITFFDPGEAHG